VCCAGGKEKEFGFRRPALQKNCSFRFHFYATKLTGVSFFWSDAIFHLCLHGIIIIMIINEERIRVTLSHRDVAGALYIIKQACCEHWDVRLSATVLKLVQKRLVEKVRMMLEMMYFRAELVQLIVSRSDSELELQRYGMKKNTSTVDPIIVGRQTVNETARKTVTQSPKVST